MIDRRKGGSIRRRVGALLTTLGLMIGGLLVLASLQLRASATQTRAENQRNRSFRLADSMRQSSNDLTLMVRLYVSTGNPDYRRYYEEILSIRAGTAPAPLGYDSSFWDRVLAKGESFVRYGPASALVDQMRAAHFRQDEFDALNASLRASNDLAVVEKEVIDRVAPRIARGVDSAYFSDVAAEYQRLVDPAYLAQKGVIMDAIGDFVAKVEARTQRAVDRSRNTSRSLVELEIVIVGAIMLVGLTTMVRTRRILLRPLGQLAVATDDFAAGNYEKRVDIRGVSELEGLAAAFNSMATAVESDVARRERAEREAVQARGAAEEANQAKSTFVAAMSHEIRTPMIGVTGMLEVLAQTELTADQQSMVSTALGSAQVLLQIIGDILDFSKIEAGRLELAPAAFMVRPLAEAVAQTFFHTASAKGLRLSCTVDDDVAPAHVGDALRIRQILSNFISNAVKFTASGHVALAVRVLGIDGVAQDLELSVSDSGIGVAPERQRELFQDFVQADASTAARSGGTGLGLVICRRLAHLMGGDVRMESAPGQGTTLLLTVRLPTADPADVDAGTGAALGGASTLLRRPKPSREQAQREGSLLLLAEDHPVNQRVLVQQLGIIGFHVDVADDGRAAFDLFCACRYALVLTDLNMPEMDGFELASAIRGHEQEEGLPPTPIVALSANVLPGEAEKCLMAGMDDFVAKPSSMPALADKLHRWLPHVEWPSPSSVEAAPGAGPARESPGGPDASDGAVVIDRTMLHQLTGGDSDLAASILLDYVGAAAADMVVLTTALSEGASADEVRLHAHRMSGASRIVGAVEVGALAAQVEAAATAPVPDWTGLRATAANMEAALDRLRQTLNSPIPAG